MKIVLPRRIVARKKGIVKEVRVQPGDKVQKGDVIVVIAPDNSGAVEKPSIPIFTFSTKDAAGKIGISIDSLRRGIKAGIYPKATHLDEHKFPRFSEGDIRKILLIRKESRKRLEEGV